MQISERKSLVDAALQFRGRGGAATGRLAVDGRFFLEQEYAFREGYKNK